MKCDFNLLETCHLMNNLESFLVTSCSTSEEKFHCSFRFNCLYLPNTFHSFTEAFHTLMSLAVVCPAPTSFQQEMHHINEFQVQLHLFCAYLSFDWFLVLFLGTFVQKACERDQEQGTCLPCDHGQTYTEHSNGMNRCLPCTHCRSGNDIIYSLCFS